MRDPINSEINASPVEKIRIAANILEFVDLALCNIGNQTLTENELSGLCSLLEDV
ncbi:MAG: hypothetical protein HRT35_07530 [Algicola sp.]|nr:hypothetical protein [Algicola sp.]